MIRNYRTTISGLCTALGAVLAAAGLQLDSDPSNDPSWGVVFVAVAAGAGLMFAKDYGPSEPEKK